MFDSKFLIFVKNDKFSDKFIKFCADEGEVMDFFIKLLSEPCTIPYSYSDYFIKVVFTMDSDTFFKAVSEDSDSDSVESEVIS